MLQPCRDYFLEQKKKKNNGKNDRETVRRSKKIKATKEIDITSTSNILVINICWINRSLAYCARTCSNGEGAEKASFQSYSMDLLTPYPRALRWSFMGERYSVWAT